MLLFMDQVLEWVINAEHLLRSSWNEVSLLLWYRACCSVQSTQAIDQVLLLPVLVSSCAAEIVLLLDRSSWRFLK